MKIGDVVQLTEDITADVGRTNELYFGHGTRGVILKYDELLRTAYVKFYITETIGYCTYCSIDILKLLPYFMD